MNEVRILILSPFTYTYGIKHKYFVCGDMFYLNPSSSLEDLEELKFILDSYQKKGWVYVDEQIVKDYSANSCIFSQTVDSTPSFEDSSTEIPEPEKVIEEVIEPKKYVSPTESVEENVIDLKVIRNEELLQLKWQDIKKIAANLNIEYTDKEHTIINILNKEFS